MQLCSQQILELSSSLWSTSNRSLGNRGDIPGFMKAYWNDDKMTFSSGGSTERGWQPTLDRYKRNYPDKKAMGNLTFSDLETSQLAEGVALMLGRWKLEKEEPVGGNFTLVWKKTRDGWKIIHDHSSADKKPRIEIETAPNAEQNVGFRIQSRDDSPP